MASWLAERDRTSLPMLQGLLRESLHVLVVDEHSLAKLTHLSTALVDCLEALAKQPQRMYVMLAQL